jgi:hypothetical protein
LVGQKIEIILDFVNKIQYMIILECVREGSKLRIRFFCYIDQNNNIYKNVYNNNYNCMFPKDIRIAGSFYSVPDADIRLSSKSGGHYYSIKRSNIQVMPAVEKQALLNRIANPPAPDISTMQIFDAGECVICLSSASTIVFIPCAHRCVCADCNITLKSTRYNCPVCRERITQDIIST